MASLGRASRTRSLTTNLSWHRAALHLVALLTLALMLWLNLLFWPIPFLGFAYDVLTQEIVTITPGSPAAQAGLLPGDRIVQLYGRPFVAVLREWSILALIGPAGVPIPIQVERQGSLRTVALAHGVPDAPFQTLKLVVLLVAMGCWSTGYLLGVARSPAALGHSAVALFWLLLGGVLGCYPFALSISLPLRLVLQWLLITTLFPLAVFSHVWFPVRPVSEVQQRQAWRWLLWSWFTLNGLGCLLVLIGRPSLPALVRLLSTPVPVAVLVGLVTAGVILQRAYHQTASAHIRRQMRLIGWACLLVALLWAIAMLLPTITQGLVFVVDQRLFGLVLLIPLAYLVSGLAPDLYRLDQVLARLCLHGLTVSLLCGLLALLTHNLGLASAAQNLWLAVLVIVLYQPLLRLLRRLIPFLDLSAARYHALYQAITHLTTTLDQTTLAHILAAGLQATFGRPPVAVYLVTPESAETLTLVVQERMSHLPTLLPAGILMRYLGQAHQVIEHDTLLNQLLHASLQSDEEAAVHQPGPALWCPVVHADGSLLAVLVVGRRGDLDPYRSLDLHEVQRVLDAAALALTNSAAYAQQQATEATIRHLYEQLQSAQDEAAAALVRELHDEVINGAIVVNVQALKRLLPGVQDQALRHELQLVLETEQSVIEGLRLISERLYPTAHNDPLGLEAELRVQLQRALSVWMGDGEMQVVNEPVPVEPVVQEAVLQIVREALINVVKHAQATLIQIELRYPADATELLIVTIRDNGQGDGPVAPKTGHWGLRSMDERARSVGGQVRVQRHPSGGVEVTICVPVPERSDTPKA